MTNKAVILNIPTEQPPSAERPTLPDECERFPQLCERMSAVEAELAGLKSTVMSAVRKAGPWGAALAVVAGSADNWIPAVFEGIARAWQALH